MPSLLQTIKTVALDAINEAKPVAFMYGVVESVNPLVIKVDQKLPLSEQFLILTNNVKDYSVQIKIDGSLKNCTINNGLKLNEKVKLLRVQGGQQYVVIDRV